MRDVFRHNRSAALTALLLLAAGLALSLGCRTAPKHAPATSPLAASPSATVVSVPPEPLALPPITNPASTKSESHSAFRPLMPEDLPKSPAAASEQNGEHKPKEEAAVKQIADLNQKIAVLESELAEAKKQAGKKGAVPSESPADKPKAENKENKSAKKSVPLPVINKPGVTVSADDLGKVHIEVIDKVLFMPNTWQLTAEGEETLRSIAAEIKAFDSTAALDIEGHTDSLLGDPKNPMQKHGISSIKAMTVMEFFVSTLRWDAAAVGTSSYGRSRPVADNGTPEGRARNNRIEIVLSSFQ